MAQVKKFNPDDFNAEWDGVIRTPDQERFLTQFMQLYPAPAPAAQFNAWKYRRDTAWLGWQMARATPAPKLSASHPKPKTK